MTFSILVVHSDWMKLLALFDVLVVELTTACPYKSDDKIQYAVILLLYMSE